MDHNYARPDHLQSVVTVWTSNGEDPNHFHPDYFGKGYRWHDPMVWRMEVAYRKAREVFEANGRVVKNATVGGCYVRHHLSLNRRLQPADRTSAVKGKSVSVRVDVGGRRSNKKKKK